MPKKAIELLSKARGIQATPESTIIQEGIDQWLPLATAMGPGSLKLVGRQPIQGRLLDESQLEFTPRVKSAWLPGRLSELSETMGDMPYFFRKSLEELKQLKLPFSER